ncbi:TOPRIM nucleotidyl transferase/hydrolase domain-containing protein [Microbacterium pumilum]|uniref:OLD protein-like TOPRIM domain-containing protein n=1 Tax=Microbacterium pumilum TaxID=344165 RepID=A0ABN2SZF7_9MICO
MPARRLTDGRTVPEGYPHGPVAALAATAALDALTDPRAIVLVEGVSDQIAVDTLAQRLGAGDRGIAVVPVGGAQGLRRMLRTIRVDHPAVPLSGLYDIAEARVIRRALEEVGLLTPTDEIEVAGFFACVSDLEDELLRACGPELIEACLADNGDIIAFRKLQKQPEWRDRPIDAQLRRWMTSGARRKLRYARIFVDTIPLERMPQPLMAVLRRARQT